MLDTICDAQANEEDSPFTFSVTAKILNMLGEDEGDIEEIIDTGGSSPKNVGGRQKGKKKAPDAAPIPDFSPEFFNAGTTHSTNGQVEKGSERSDNVPTQDMTDKCPDVCAASDGLPSEGASAPADAVSNHLSSTTGM
jgi:hypothetical protein